MLPAPEALQRLIDRDAIEDVLKRYARGIDRLDAELLHTVFWDDGGFEDGAFDGPAKEFVPLLIGQALPVMFACTQHFVGNIRVEFAGPELAFAECYFLAFHLVNPGEQALDAVLGPERMRELGGDYARAHELWVGGRYFDRLEKRADRWRIKTRRFVGDFTTSGPASGLNGGGFASLFKLRASRDRHDPSYSHR